jgi:hypothetical protein
MTLLSIGTMPRKERGLPFLELANLEFEYKHVQFRVAVARALGREWKDMGCVFQTGNVVASPGIAHGVRLSFGKKVVKNTGDLHLSFYEKIPLMEDGKGRVRQLVRIYEKCPKQDLAKKLRRIIKWCPKKDLTVSQSFMHQRRLSIVMLICSWP